MTRYHVGDHVWIAVIGSDGGREAAVVRSVDSSTGEAREVLDRNRVILRDGFSVVGRREADAAEVARLRRMSLVNGRNLVGIVKGTAHVDRCLLAVRWSDWGWAVVRPAGQARKENHLRVEKFRARSGSWTARLSVPAGDVLSRRDLLELEEKDLRRLLSIARKALRNW